MKIIITILFLTFPVVAFAQSQGTDQVDMQKLQQAMDEMILCMANIDQAELAALGEKSEQFEQEIKELCSQGKRDLAQEKAIVFTEEIMKNKALEQMKKCGEINKKYGIPQDEDSSSMMDSDFDFSKHHVCDDLDEE